ncbi:sigma factor-like helix-turn-helix DNA-binding protein [Clostridium sp. Mt-5]|uniref:Sigma factor-like helix-turn-helix DNA-binding protein n=1 Tax=Clostridium moutaii TaxID=3240932 RepID=A0ABV4BQY2_9CLOT
MRDNYRKLEGILYNYKNIKAEIKNIDLDMEDLQQEYTGCGSITYEEKAAPTNKFNSSVENEIISKEKQISYLQNMRDGKKRLIDKIDNALDALSENERKLIELRYFDKLHFKEVAIRLNINDTYCMQFKSKVINKLIPMIFIIKI